MGGLVTVGTLGTSGPRAQSRDPGYGGPRAESGDIAEAEKAGLELKVES